MLPGDPRKAQRLNVRGSSERGLQEGTLLTASSLLAFLIQICSIIVMGCVASSDRANGPRYCDPAEHKRVEAYILLDRDHRLKRQGFT